MRTTSDLFDQHPEICWTCPQQFLSFGGRRRFCGPIQTVRCLNDNILLQRLLEKPGNGGVLVVDGGGSTSVALMGDRIATMAVNNAWAGIVLNAAVRDVRQLRELDLGIWALGSNPAISCKIGTGETGIPVYIAGAEFRRDNWLYADEDGLLLAPKQLD